MTCHLCIKEEIDSSGFCKECLIYTDLNRKSKGFCPYCAIPTDDVKIINTSTYVVGEYEANNGRTGQTFTVDQFRCGVCGKDFWEKR